MQIGFFHKERSDSDGKPAGKAKRTLKEKPAHELPLVLKVRVPVEKIDEKKAKLSSSDKPQLELDIECYINYFLVKFRRQDGSVIEFEMTKELERELDRKGIRKLLAGHEIVTFNGDHYDIPMLRYALHIKDCSNEDLKNASDELIKGQVAVWKFEERHGLPDREYDHIDLAQLTPFASSLKLCGARLHCEHLQELPYEEDATLNDKQMNEVADYCDNDVDVLALLKDDLTEEIELRRVLSARYGVDLRSKSDPQIAEEIIKAEMYKRTGRSLKKPAELRTVHFIYQIPEFISFSKPELNTALDILRTKEFVARPVSSGIKMPEELSDLKISIGSSVYRMGIGGLHSSEKTAFHLADDEYDYYDLDVTSYYPSIILQCGLYPQSIGEHFLDIFEDVVNERVAAKIAKDKVKAESMKITVNGTFGKLGSPYSILYAPELMIQVTVTGQLSLLMLIEMLERHGFSVVNGNTDGVVVRCEKGRKEFMMEIVKRWEKRTGFAMESTQYAGLWSRDVNNYIAIGSDGKVKLKGCFAPGKLKKNPEYDICSDALVAYLRDGTPVEKTIQDCQDITKFISVRRVNGGAVKHQDGKLEYLGKVVRWYYSRDEKGTINYKTNGNKVPQTDGARPLPILPDKFPDDIDYDWYARKCREMFY